MSLCEEVTLRCHNPLSKQLVEVRREMPPQERLVRGNLQDFGERLGSEARLVHLQVGRL